MTLYPRREWLYRALGVMVASAASGCGTLLYPERRGQRAGRLDWKVVLLDGIGLLFFFIPGVIAFAVDFINGTIYLPSDSVPCEPTPVTSTAPRARGELVQIKVPRSELSPGRIEKLIAERTGKQISLDDGRYVTQEMKSINDFWETHDAFSGHSLGRSLPVS